MPSFQATVLVRSMAASPTRMPIGLLPLAIAAHGGEFVRRMDERLGGDAADIEAGAARLAFFDDDGVDAELSGADGADIAARAGADDEKLADDLFHGLSLR